MRRIVSQIDRRKIIENSPKLSSAFATAIVLLGNDRCDVDRPLAWILQANLEAFRQPEGVSIYRLQPANGTPDIKLEHNLTVATDNRDVMGWKAKDRRDVMGWKAQYMEPPWATKIAESMTVTNAIKDGKLRVIQPNFGVSWDFSLRIGENDPTEMVEYPPKQKMQTVIAPICEEDTRMGITITIGVMHLYGRDLGIHSSDSHGKEEAQEIAIYSSLMARGIADIYAHRYDHLTNLPTRRQFEKEVLHAIQHCRETGEPFGLMIFDLDKFGACNNKYGHLVGDAVLAHFSKDALTRSIRTGKGSEDDLVARYGGEEFVALLKGRGRQGQILTREALLAAGERVRRATEEMELNVGNDIVRITVSGGAILITKEILDKIIETLNHDGAAPDNEAVMKIIMKLVDDALYVSKGDGRNMIHEGYFRTREDGGRKKLESGYYPPVK